MKLTNESGIALSVAVYLATDDYDYDPTAISATSLLKPIRQTILGKRLPKEFQTIDILSLVKSRTGTSIHSGLELAWRHNYKNALEKLGYPKSVIDKVIINPPDGSDLRDKIPVYLEKRSYRELDGVRYSGKFDLVAEGRLEDLKTTSTFTYTKGVKDKDYQLQGSIYRWLNPKIITADHAAIQFIFTDWKAGLVKPGTNYPKIPVIEHKVPLLSLSETEDFIRHKKGLLDRYESYNEMDLPLCTDEELWKGPSVWKYFRKESNVRATKSCDTLAEALEAKAKHNEGIIKEVPGKAKACNYCSAAPICSQRQDLSEKGLLAE